MKAENITDSAAEEFGQRKVFNLTNLAYSLALESTILFENKLKDIWSSESC